MMMLLVIGSKLKRHLLHEQLPASFSGKNLTKVIKEFR